MTTAIADDIPEIPGRIINEYCIECHDSSTSEGDIDLSSGSIDWANRDNRKIWERVLRVNDEQIMPPADELQPTDEERAEVSAWLDKQLLKHTPFGGTLPRRLNRAEYQATIRQLMLFPEFTLPLGFPRDAEYHGFTNVGEGLVLSPPHLEAYFNTARDIADQIFPPAKSTPKKQTWRAGPEDMVLSFSAASVHGDALRLASRSIDVMRSCSWASRIEIRDSGTYRISVDASKFLSDEGRPFDDAMILEVYARAVTATDRSKIQDFRLLKKINVCSEEPELTVFEADLYEGETVLFYWQNAEMTHDKPAVGEAFEEISKDDPRFLAAWLKVVYPSGDPKRPVHLPNLRGRNGWDAVNKHMNDPNLDLSQAAPDSALAKAFFQLATQKASQTIADCLCYYYHQKGPALEIRSLSIEGPSKLVDSPTDLERREQQRKLTGTIRPGQSQEEFLRGMLSDFLPRAFRKPVSPETIESYLTIATRHWDDGHTYDEGMHLLLRNILISPRFLYRCLDPDGMDDFDLATRLSYFLTQAPPDATLIDLANRNRLSATLPSTAHPSQTEFWVLRQEAERLLPKSHTDAMVQSFVGQWLDTEFLQAIMPDPKFKFDETSVEMAKYETERFFIEMLTMNLPMTDFIDPDFTFTSPQFAKDVYGLDPKDLPGSGTKAKRINLERGGRVGGLLGQSSVMLTTANGVDTQPVLRGVWVLENILGARPLPPPKDVPALTPDTQGTTNPREMLAAHTSDISCSSCHQRIDPIGFGLENFDAVGRWRTEWPGTNSTIDASSVMVDGTKIQDVVDLKRWLVANIDVFSQCVAEKLMTYGTGRVPNHTEKQEIEEIVKKNHEKGNGFRDLVLALIESKTFRTR